jgi:hypothetical protein
MNKKTKNLRKSDQTAMKGRTAANKKRKQETLQAHVSRNQAKRSARA